MKIKHNLLGKYYKSETTLDEERELKMFFADETPVSSEKEMFAFYAENGTTPDDLEETLFAGVQKKTRQKTLRTRIISSFSTAAVVLILLGVYLNFRTRQNAKINNEFLVMEQALFQVSENLQPEPQQDLLVLWVDENVEIIIN